MSAKKPVKQKIAITIDDYLLEKIDDYWHENRLRSRSASIQELLLAGVEAMEEQISCSDGSADKQHD